MSVLWTACLYTRLWPGYSSEASELVQDHGCCCELVFGRTTSTSTRVVRDWPAARNSRIHTTRHNTAHGTLADGLDTDAARADVRARARNRAGSMPDSEQQLTHLVTLEWRNRIITTAAIQWRVQEQSWGEGRGGRVYRGRTTGEVWGMEYPPREKGVKIVLKYRWQMWVVIVICVIRE